MDAFPQTSIERTYNPSLQLKGIDQQYGPETDTVPQGRGRRLGESRSAAAMAAPGSP